MNKIKKIDLKNCPKLLSALKMKKKKYDKSSVYWKKREAGGYSARIIIFIDKSTKLYKGKKVLYKGK